MYIMKLNRKKRKDYSIGMEFSCSQIFHRQKLFRNSSRILYIIKSRKPRISRIDLIQCVDHCGPKFPPRYKTSAWIHKKCRSIFVRAFFHCRSPNMALSTRLLHSSSELHSGCKRMRPAGPVDYWIT